MRASFSRSVGESGRGLEGPEEVVREGEGVRSRFDMVDREILWRVCGCMRWVGEGCSELEVSCEPELWDGRW